MSRESPLIVMQLTKKFLNKLDTEEYPEFSEKIPAGIFSEENVDERFKKKYNIEIDEPLFTDSEAPESSKKIVKPTQEVYTSGISSKIISLPFNAVKYIFSCCSSIWEGIKSVSSSILNKFKNIDWRNSLVVRALRFCVLDLWVYLGKIVSWPFVKIYEWIKQCFTAKPEVLKSKEEIKKETELKHKQLWEDLGLTKTSRAIFLSENVKYGDFLTNSYANPAIILMAVMLKLVKEGYDDSKTKLEEWEKANTAMKIMSDEKCKIANQNAELQATINQSNAFIKVVAGTIATIVSCIPGVGKGIGSAIVAVGEGINALSTLKLNYAKEKNQASIESLNNYINLVNSLVQHIAQAISHTIQMIAAIFAMSQENLRTSKDCNMAITQGIR